MKKSLQYTKEEIKFLKEQNAPKFVMNMIPTREYKELKFSSIPLEKDAILLTGEIGRMEGTITLKK